MSALHVLSRPEFQRLGLALLHFVWEGFAVAALVGVAIAIARPAAGHRRYAVYLFGLAAMFACPIITYLELPAMKVVDAAVAGRVGWVGTTSNEAPRDGIATDGREIAANDAHRISSLKDSASFRPAAASPAVTSHPVAAGWNWWKKALAFLPTALPWALVAWGAGVAVLALQLLVGLLTLHHWKRGARAFPADVRARGEALAGRMGFAQFSRFFTSPHVGQPGVLGFWRPVVVLPASLLTQLPPEMIDAILAHELAHIRRLDPWVNLAQRLIETLLFYHPAVWWISGRVRAQREICCDEMAVIATERITYVCALERVARFTLGLPGLISSQNLALSFGGTRPALLIRIQHLLGAPPPHSRNNWPAGVMAIVTLLAAVGIARSAAQKPNGPAGNEKPSVSATSRSDENSNQNAPAGSNAFGNSVASEGGASPRQHEPESNHQADKDDGGLLTPSELARKEALAQAIRNEERAKLDVQEAKLMLQAKMQDLARDVDGRKQHLIAQSEVDSARLAVSLAEIQVQRAELSLQDAHAKTQNQHPSTLRVNIEDARGLGRTGDNFSLPDKAVSLRQALARERKKLDEQMQMGDGRVTVYRHTGNKTDELVKDLPLEHVLAGVGPDPELKAGDEVEVKFDLRVARNVTFRFNVPGQPGGGSWSMLRRRDMTLTQVLAASNYDPTAMANQPVTLIRKQKNGTRRVILKGVPMSHLLDGTVKDEIIKSGDEIMVGKAPAETKPNAE